MRRLLIPIVLFATLTSALAAPMNVKDLPSQFNAASKATGSKLRMVQKECLPNGPVHVCTEVIGTSLSAIISTGNDRKTITDITLLFHSDPKLDEWVAAIIMFVTIFSPEIDKETRATAFMALINAKPNGAVDNEVTFGTVHYRVKKVEGLGVFAFVEIR